MVRTRQARANMVERRLPPRRGGCVPLQMSRESRPSSTQVLGRKWATTSRKTRVRADADQRGADLARVPGCTGRGCREFCLGAVRSTSNTPRPASDRVARKSFTRQHFRSTEPRRREGVLLRIFSFFARTHDSSFTPTTPCRRERLAESLRSRQRRLSLRRARLMRSTAAMNQRPTPHGNHAMETPEAASCTAR